MPITDNQSRKMLQTLGGVTATFSPSDAPEFEATVIFEREWLGEAVGGDLEVTGSEMVITAVSSDVETMKNEDTVEIDGTEYAIRDIMPDGTGITKIRVMSKA